MTNDDPTIVSFMKTASVADILARTDYWGEDLSFMLDEVSKYANS